MLKEFKEFVLRGNVMDMAVGVILGAAFGRIITSLVNDVLMPVIGLLLGGVNFGNLEYSLGNTVIKYGSFLQAVLDFTIIAFVIFLTVRTTNRWKKQPIPPDPTTRECPQCFSTIPIKATRCPHCTSQL